MANNIRFILCRCPICGAPWEIDFTIDTPATCTAEGSKSIHCSACEEIKDVTVIPATGHTVVIDSAEVAPTCTGTGLTEGSHCSVCDAIISVQTEVPALGHNLVNHAAQTPTCTEVGWDAYDTCSRCAYTTYVEIAATGHTPAIDAAVAPTCTETGLTEGSHCSVCQAVITAQQEVPAAGHTYGDWAVVTPATTTSAGTERRDCVNCEHYVTRDIPMLCAVSIQLPSTTTVNLGDTLVLHANIANGPAGSKIAWSVVGSGVEINPSTNGSTCDVKSTGNGTATLTATVVDTNDLLAAVNNHMLTNVDISEPSLEEIFMHYYV